ncbi:putative nuclear fragile x mental retardation-interacting protein 1 protein [Phaeoacremonium minimum UCRPA7]|uniref:Putative nuclear fragile x mental retardation-interacting protein 1 protein n=1 Tax=Phaeoacremonium minimum (strain UCR-PA7) TaxID=1286976 RepID=R8BER0_PHAM7|nr:putative nuclear fragile x mental retardation-interacting protein 1 protein [Phaeoacremonium minimum UCRPA7]EON97787.1 putative nuclear fragile x mental retardation-interacting protein 1 protein [Phaeoacremonium minimum UCRPA7]
MDLRIPGPIRPNIPNPNLEATRRNNGQTRATAIPSNKPLRSRAFNHRTIIQTTLSTSINNLRGPPSTPNTHHQKPDAASAGKKKKRKTNTLGLTPGDDSDEDDVDEEAKLTEMIGADAPQPQDISAWIAERRRNFPTQARVKAKLAAESVQSSNGIKEEDADPRGVSLSAYEKQQQKADKLRKQLEKVESSLKRKREQQDAGDEMRDVTISSSVSSSSKSDDEKPEALSTKQEQPAYLPPPPKKADPTKHCKYYSTGGTCGKKGKCRFVHDPAVREAALKERELNGGRMTLQQRLILNDKDQEDLTIIKTLQYLKEKGLMREDKTASEATVLSAQLTNGEGAQPSSTPKSFLPPPPVGLPAQPPPSVLSGTSTVRYQGWNLSGFGNTGVKSGDS